MTKDELIAKQQIEIEELKQQSKERKSALKDIVSQCVCIGGPLNDNICGYTPRQIGDFHQIVIRAEEAI